VTIDPKLLELLVCPKCKGDLYTEIDREGLICAQCRLEYPVRNGIPDMLAEHAMVLDREKE